MTRLMLDGFDNIYCTFHTFLLYQIQLLSQESSRFFLFSFIYIFLKYNL